MLWLLEKEARENNALQHEHRSRLRFQLQRLDGERVALLNAASAGMGRAVIGWGANRDRLAFKGTMKQRQK